jgi:hypothetical protein
MHFNTLQPVAQIYCYLGYPLQASYDIHPFWYCNVVSEISIDWTYLLILMSEGIWIAAADQVGLEVTL